MPTLFGVLALTLASQGRAATYTTEIALNGSPLAISTCSASDQAYVEVNGHTYVFGNVPYFMATSGYPLRNFNGVHHEVDLLNNAAKAVTAFELKFDVEDQFGSELTSSTWNYRYKVAPESMISHDTLGLTYTELTGGIAGKVICTVTAVTFDDGSVWTQSPTAGPAPSTSIGSFKAPIGWTVVSYTPGRTEKWTNSDGSQSIVVGWDEFEGAMDDFQHNIATSIRSTYTDAVHGALSHAQMCGVRPADELVWTVQRNSVSSTIETLWTEAYSQEYWVIYTRPAEAPGDQSVEAALLTLCPN